MRSRDVARAFTLIELLIVVVVIAILAGVALLTTSRAKERANIAVMKADLRNIASMQEVLYGDSGVYSVSIPDLSVSLSPGVTLVSATATNVPAAWSVIVQHVGTSRTCGLAVGGNGSAVGVIQCQP